MSRSVSFYDASGVGTISYFGIRDRLAEEPPSRAFGMVVQRIQGGNGGEDPLWEFDETDVLFGYAIRAHLLFLPRGGPQRTDSVLWRLLHIGIYDWGTPMTRGPRFEPGEPVRYAAVLGYELFRRIESLEERVRLSRFESCFGLTRSSSVSARNASFRSVETNLQK
jgi:hypothetical protein